jgi:hypothetical protein
VTQSLERSRERAGGLSTLAERLTAAADAADANMPADAEPLLQAIDAAYRELQAAEQWLDASEAVARGVNRIAESAAASRAEASQPDASPDSSSGVTAKKVAEFSADVADAIVRLEVIRQGLIDLRAKRTLAREFAARTIARVADLDRRLANLSSRIGAFQLRVAAARAACAELGRNIRWWTAFAAVAITLVLLWFAGSQIGMTVHGWRFARPAAQ